MSCHCLTTENRFKPPYAPPSLDIWEHEKATFHAPNTFCLYRHSMGSGYIMWPHGVTVANLLLTLFTISLFFMMFLSIPQGTNTSVHIAPYFELATLTLADLKFCKKLASGGCPYWAPKVILGIKKLSCKDQLFHHLLCGLELCHFRGYIERFVMLYIL